MKLPIKHKYFKQIKSGEKDIEYRDAHITFIDEKTKETLRMEVTDAGVEERTGRKEKGVLEDENVIWFELKKS